MSAITKVLSALELQIVFSLAKSKTDYTNSASGSGLEKNSLSLLM